VTPTAQLALDTILQRPTVGIPSWIIHVMEHAQIERLAGAAPGDYRRDPVGTYLALQRAAGTCLLDQYIPDNPLTMGDRGFEGGGGGVTTGAHEIIVDGLRIDSPEAVCEHLERFVFPALEQAVTAFDEDARTREVLAQEASVQETLGPDILKVPYGCAGFPGLGYGTYGYVAYFQAYALYPEVMQRHFGLQADLALRNNRAVARAITEGQLPPLIRLDHDMADSRGTLVDERTLDRIWFPHFTRCLEPLRQAGVRLIWHCDGNLMAMVPRLLEAGLHGFQGFQYEDGMDYERICRMRTRDGEELIIIAGVSVTRTLPHGTPQDVRDEMSWLVEHGPRTGLFLGGTSSICPGVPWENMVTFVEGLKHYQKHGRAEAPAL